MVRLLLVRHGRSEMNAERRVQGWLDSPLDDMGRAQARALVKRLRTEAPALLYTSPLRRAQETAEIIAAALGIGVMGDERLKERGVGDLAGLTGAEIEARFPGFLESWRSTRMVAPPGGEAPRRFGERVAAAFEQIVARHPDSVVGVVTHGGVLAVYLGYLLGIETGRWAPFSFGNGSLSVVDIDGAGVRIRVVNERCHLPVEEGK